MEASNGTPVVDKHECAFLQILFWLHGCGTVHPSPTCKGAGARMYRSRNLGVRTAVVALSC